MPRREKAQWPGLLFLSLKNDCDHLMVSLTGSPDQGLFLANSATFCPQRRPYRCRWLLGHRAAYLGAWASDLSPFSPDPDFSEVKAIFRCFYKVHVRTDKLNSFTETSRPGETSQLPSGRCFYLFFRQGSSPRGCQLHQFCRKGSVSCSSVQWGWFRNP